MGVSQGYNQFEMSRPFESFEYLDRGWDVRMFENCFLRRAFVTVVLLGVVLGMDVAVNAYQVFLFRRVNWSEAVYILVAGVLVFRYSRAIYRRLGQ